MGQSNSIIEDCKKIGVDITEDQCKVKFDPSGKVLTFGEIEKGKFEADTDIAGQGVVIAFLVPSIVVCVLGLIFAIARIISAFRRWRGRKSIGTSKSQAQKRHSSWLHEHFDDLVTSCSDAQLLVLLAFGIAFGSRSQCEVSGYHYTVAVHMVLDGLATSILAMVIARDTRDKIVSALARIVIFIVCLVGLFLSNLNLTDLQAFDKTTGIKNKLPGKDQHDSMLVMPVFCLLETTFDPFSGLSSEEKKYLTHTGLSRNAFVQRELILTLFVLVIVPKFVTGIFAPKGAETVIDDDLTVCGINARRLYFYATGFFKMLVWGIATGLICWNWVMIYSLRDWAEDSGWLELEDGENPERDVQGLGQVAPLVSLLGIGIAFVAALYGLLPFNKKDDNQNPNPNAAIPLQNMHHGYSPLAP